MTDHRDPRIRRAITGLALASRQAPTFDEVCDAQSPPTPVRGRRPWVVAVAAAVVALLVIGGGSLLLGGSESMDEPVAPIEDTVNPSGPIPDPESLQLRHAGSAESVGWTVVDTSPDPWVYQPGFLDGSWIIFDRGWRCLGPDGFHADCYSGETPKVGSVGSPDPTEILWTSTNGVDWTATEITAFRGKVVNQRSAPSHADVHGGLLWAITSPLDQWWRLGEIWVSDDGLTWHEVEWLDNSGPRTRHLSDLQASRLGDTIFVTATDGYSSTRRLWVSSDAGLSFSPVDLSPDGATRVIATHWADDDEFRAIVLSYGGGAQPLTLWRSTDAATWELVGPVEGLEDAPWGWNPLEASFTGEALLVDRTGDDCEIDIARSLNGGLTWQRIDGIGEFLEQVESGGEGCFELSTVSDGWAAVQSIHGVHVSPNGFDWYHIDNADLFIGMVYLGILTDNGWAMPPPE